MKISAVLLTATLLGAPLLAGCATKTGDLTEDAGIQAVRSACPITGIAADTGNVTVFDPPASTAAEAIDVVANMTNLRATCGDSGDDVVTNLTFDVQARRTRTDAARTVTLPFFTTVVRGGNAVVAKRLGQVTLQFAPGAERAQAQGTAYAVVNRAAATLPEEVRATLTRKRKPGDEDAAIDPLSLPETRAAVLRATFEALVGFQLTEAQLKYNATR